MMMNQTLIFDYKNIGFRTEDLEEFLRRRKINISLPRCRDITDLGLKDAFGFLDHHPGAKEKAAALWEPVTVIVSQAEEWNDLGGPSALNHDEQKATTQQAAELIVLQAKLQEEEAARQAAEELAARLGAEVEALKAALLQATQEDRSDKLHPRTETSLLLIVASLLELARTPRPGRDSEAAVIRELVDNFSDRPGISKYNLEKQFAAAKRKLP